MRGTNEKQSRLSTSPIVKILHNLIVEKRFVTLKRWARASLTSEKVGRGQAFTCENRARVRHHTSTVLIHYRMDAMSNDDLHGDRRSSSLEKE